jgi:hypothetical protein
MSRKKFSRSKNVFFSILLVLYVITAIVQQLQRPPEERTWYGKIAGIPYDFRLPTAERIRDTFWNKNTSKIFLPQVFGIGWSINLYPIIYPEEVQKLQ